MTRNGHARSGTSNQGGALLRTADRQNRQDYAEVVNSGLGALYSLGSEVYGRWSTSCTQLVPALARERARGLHPRVRRGAALALLNRWWCILGVALQNA
eukprot:6310408-Karenia_brevis.AAC.1